ncbi:hypothetical protein E3T61_09845 [Cryobacterium lactosi]|uniref:Uncharacterized protein n=1 Tax=Cryobacterium lactosi TaxID=1259202 RepID=A0A4V3IXN4_9MICO|nr:hypothetical protein [Cryobacterium lactosi]TFD90806.1 hypothetical protein E3T61_09845 [Cryobacterium lactosi]
MSVVSNSRNTGRSDQPQNDLWYYLVMGAAFAGTVIAASVLPAGFNGLAFTGLLVVIAVAEGLARRFGVSSFIPRSGRSGWTFFIVVVAMIAVSGVLVMTVVRPNDVVWLAWTLAGLNVVVFVGGWIARGHFNRSRAVRAL